MTESVCVRKATVERGVTSANQDGLDTPAVSSASVHQRGQPTRMAPVTLSVASVHARATLEAGDARHARLATMTTPPASVSVTLVKTKSIESLYSRM